MTKQVNGSVGYRLSGRLGNHLQLWGCARTLSLRYGWDLEYSPILYADRFALDEQSYSRPARLAGLLRPRVRLMGHGWDETGNASGQVVERLRRAPGRRYRLEWSGIFTRLDEFRGELHSELLSQPIPPRSDDAVGVHLRRTDAALPLPLPYYVRAISHVAPSGGRVNVYSDGPTQDLAAEMSASLPNHDVQPQSGDAVSDLLALAGHRRLVMSWSWFSYWAAYLSPPGGHILAPEEFAYYPEWEPFPVQG